METNKRLAAPRARDSRAVNTLHSTCKLRGGRDKAAVWKCCLTGANSANPQQSGREGAGEIIISASSLHQISCCTSHWQALEGKETSWCGPQSMWRRLETGAGGASGWGQAQHWSACDMHFHELTVFTGMCYFTTRLAWGGRVRQHGEGCMSLLL